MVVGKSVYYFLQLGLKVTVLSAPFNFGIANAFTYLADGATTTQDSGGQISFYLSSDVPTLSEKEEFENGIYASFTDQAAYAEILKRAMALWNNVPGKYYTLVIGSGSLGKQDASDNLNSIAFGNLSLSAGASASPVLGNNGKNIVDCDITIPESATLSYFAKAIAHELGHCLGLGHEHKDHYALMSYNFSEFKVTLDDAAGVATLYPASSHSADKNFVPCGNLGSSGHKSSLGLSAFWALLFPLLLSSSLRLAKKHTFKWGPRPK